MKKYKSPKKLSAKEVLEYVCWIADADRLYEFSLGTYNLEIVVLVAQQTQKVKLIRL
jgi:elongator complex protein 1